MTITSYGYTGTITPNDVWAKMQRVLGAVYWVGATNPAGPVTATSDGSRNVTVGTGTMGGWGIYDNISATETCTLPSVGADTYFLIVAHRDWSATNPTTGNPGVTTIAAINAGTSLPTVLPTSGRAITPGVADDQPLALVMLTSAGITSIIYDLRLIGGKDTFSLGVPSYQGLNPGSWIGYANPYGITVYDGGLAATSSGTNFVGTKWIYVATSGSSGTWVPDPLIVQSGPSFGNPLGIINGGAGWSTTADLISKGSQSGNNVRLTLQCRHSSSSNPISFTSTRGNNATDFIVPMSVGNPMWLPPHPIDVPFQYVADDGGTYGGWASYGTDGDLTIISGVPGSSIAQRASGLFSIRASNIGWIQEQPS